jgi:hypothetical protein
MKTRTIRRRSVALRLWHPSWSPEVLTNGLGMKPDFSWSVGMPRKTPKGQPLTGHYKETYCSIDLPVAYARLARSIDDIVADVLVPHRNLLRRVAATGGRTELYIAWRTNANVGDTFSWQLLQTLVDLRVTLSVESFTC